MITAYTLVGLLVERSTPMSRPAVTTRRRLLLPCTTVVMPAASARRIEKFSAVLKMLLPAAFAPPGKCLAMTCATPSR